MPKKRSTGLTILAADQSVQSAGAHRRADWPGIICQSKEVWYTIPAGATIYRYRLRPFVHHMGQLWHLEGRYSHGPLVRALVGLKSGSLAIEGDGVIVSAKPNQRFDKDRLIESTDQYAIRQVHEDRRRADKLSNIETILAVCLLLVVSIVALVALPTLLESVEIGSILGDATPTPETPTTETPTPTPSPHFG